MLPPGYDEPAAPISDDLLDGGVDEDCAVVVDGNASDAVVNENEVELHDREPLLASQADVAVHGKGKGEGGEGFSESAAHVYKARDTQCGRSWCKPREQWQEAACQAEQEVGQPVPAYRGCSRDGFAGRVKRGGSSFRGGGCRRRRDISAVVGVVVGSYA